MLAARSRSVLDAYRQGHAIPETCPLKRALTDTPAASQKS
jgi:hypothetical protein